MSLVSRGDFFDMADRVFDNMLNNSFALFDPKLNKISGSGGSRYGYNSFSLDMTETDEACFVKADLPGFDKKDIKVTFNKAGFLTISAERNQEKEEKNDNYIFRERSTGSFSRSIKLNFAVNQQNISASYENGVLSLTLPKTKDSGIHTIDIA